MSAMRIIVTGVNGQIARALQAQAASHGAEIIPMARPDFDLADAANAGALLERHAPDLVISAAAYTAVDLAETNRAEAEAVNAVGPGMLSAACAARGLPILHLSTDYVFDGAKPTPYLEDDPTGPTGVYGATKLAGERAVAAANPRHVILRTAWVFAPEGKNFVRTMLRLAETRDEIAVVADQFGSPSYAPDLAEALFTIADQIRSAEPGDPRYGIFHMTGSGDTSWAGFASAIFDLAARRGMPSAAVRAISSAEFPTPTKRPANSRLSGARLRARYGIVLPHWHDALARGIDVLSRTG